jgi:hypothetical protein
VHAMSLGGESLSPRMYFPSSSRWSASVLMTLPFPHSDQQASSHPFYRHLATHPGFPVLELHSSSSAPLLPLSVLRPVRPVQLFPLTKRGAPFRLPWPVFPDAAEAWGSGMKISHQLLLSAGGISRVKPTPEARIGASVYAGVHLMGGGQWRSGAERRTIDKPFRLKKSPLYFPENARVLGKSPINSMIWAIWSSSLLYLDPEAGSKR